jgi:hypothetical protein
LGSLLQLFAENLLPIILIAGVGAFLQRKLDIDPRSFSRIIFYTFTPAFVFSLLVSTEIETSGILRMAAFAFSMTICIGGLSWIVSRLLRLPPHFASAFILTATFMNSGNFGLSLTSFALGEVGLAWATIYFVTSSMMTNSLGVYVTSVGKRTPQQALLGLLRVPAVYAIPVALLVRISDITLPLPITRPIELLGRATVPSMLILLGMQISRSGLPKHPKLLLGSSALRLVISPLIAWLIAPLFNLTGMAFQAGIIETATPTAVLTMVIATEFDVEPEFVTSAVMITTILSPLTLTPLLAILGI